MGSILQLIATLVTAASFCAAVWVYRFNARTRRADLIYKLHTDFFVSETYKEVREAMDGIDKPDHLRLLLKDEPDQLIAYLNFFEMISYLMKNKHLKMNDLKALFRYYLRVMQQNEDLMRYLAVKSKSFEGLEGLLNNEIF